jgi:Domain of unknown function (DUF4124)
MSKILVLLIGLALAGAAQAQIKCWTTADGKRACGDAPPAGAKVTTVRGASAPPDGAPATAASAKDAPKGPQTAAEKEQDYRKRQGEAQKAAAKAEQEQQDAAAKKENCDRSRETLRSLESGERIQRTDAKGERYIMEDAQREQETVKARTLVQQACS